MSAAGRVGSGGDFASALYLGMRHPSGALGAWPALTTGVPAALAPPPGAAEAARELAALQGCEAAVLAPSTLHLFLDLFALLAGTARGVAVDAGAYPVARWGARCSGRPVHRFRHHDADSLRRVLRRMRGAGRPLVLADGVCPDCGRAAPLADYLNAAREAGATLIVDDTQALGILGSGPSPGAPYGSGGGGSLRRWEIGGGDVAVGASLAKAFGAPVAVLAASRGLVARFRSGSRTAVHSSPPSTAALRAAARAVAQNRRAGDRLRARLADRVAGFRSLLAERRIAADGGWFPVQTLAGVADPPRVHRRLAGEGIRAVLRAAPGPRLTFLLRADHGEDELARAADAVARAAGTAEPGRRRCDSQTSAGRACG